jgi:hypothetical protein
MNLEVEQVEHGIDQPQLVQPDQSQKLALEARIFVSAA